MWCKFEEGGDGPGGKEVQMRIGDLEVHIVSDGRVEVDAGGPFGLVPRALYRRYFDPSVDNLVPMVLNCLLVRSKGKTILIDTGLGDKLSEEEIAGWHHARPEGGLIAGLARLGVSPEDVDIVINTHLHADHCGGNTCWSGEAALPTFPNATYLVQRIEWAEASHVDGRTRGTYHSNNFDPVMRKGRLRLLYGDYQVTDQVLCVVTPGHTRGHQSVMLSSGSWRGLYVADMASYAVHFQRTAWLTAYDVFPLENIATKGRWQQWALQEKAWLFFEHDPYMPVARLVERGSRRELEPLEIDA
jgi:glyoxylase-like metal-dependent hydrolase (beta-lactamase superfamily II)